MAGNHRAGKAKRGGAEAARGHQEYAEYPADQRVCVLLAGTAIHHADDPDLPGHAERVQVSQCTRSDDTTVTFRLTYAALISLGRMSFLLGWPCITQMTLICQDMLEVYW